MCIHPALLCVGLLPNEYTSYGTVYVNLQMLFIDITYVDYMSKDL